MLIFVQDDADEEKHVVWRSRKRGNPERWKIFERSDPNFKAENLEVYFATAWSACTYDENEGIQLSNHCKYHGWLHKDDTLRCCKYDGRSGDEALQILLKRKDMKLPKGTRCNVSSECNYPNHQISTSPKMLLLLSGRKSSVTKSLK